jgi:hypothetical protein
MLAGEKDAFGEAWFQRKTGSGEQINRKARPSTEAMRLPRARQFASGTERVKAGERGVER